MEFTAVKTMELSGIPQPKMDWESSNLPAEWKKFKQHVELILAGPLNKKEEAEKCTYVLLWVGSKGGNLQHVDADRGREKQTRTYLRQIPNTRAAETQPGFCSI